MFFTRDKIRKTCLQNHPSLILKLPPTQMHFAKTTLSFSVITKIPFLLALLNFQKFHKNTHKLYTNKHIFHTNKYMSSITSTRTVTAFPSKKNLVPRFGRKTFKGRKTNHPSEVAKSNQTRED
jgi:hypothetical protein